MDHKGSVVFLNDLAERQYIQTLNRMVELMADDLSKILSASFNKPIPPDFIVESYHEITSVPGTIQSILIDEGKLTLSEIIEGFLIEKYVDGTCEVLRELEVYP